MTTTSPGPSADSITVAETLELLNGRFSEFAGGVADGSYAMWLGSGLSRGRVPGLDKLIVQVLEFLHARSDPSNPDCPHRAALEAALEMARLRPDERARINPVDAPATWSHLDLVVNGLSDQYSEFLAIQVEGQEPDYLLWEAVDVRATYGATLEPDCEHLCIGILVLEGAISEAVSANWDGLIEAALARLAGDGGDSVRVVVLPLDLRDGARVLTLVKCHGCAVLAAQDPATYRAAIVGTRPQITAWDANAFNQPIRNKMIAIATSMPTVMLGLSAQDENIQRVFAQAQADMPWSWPTTPPAHIIAADRLGLHHVNILRVVYAQDYTNNAAGINEETLLRAYGKPLLTALVLFVLAAKLRAYLAEADAPHLSDADRQDLATGLGTLAQLLADRAHPTCLDFVEAFVANQRRAFSLFQHGSEPDASGPAYTPLGPFPADRVSTDPSLPTNGLRELAAALAVLGRGAAHGTWSLDIGPVAGGAHAVLKVISGGPDAAVFFAANGKAAVHLQTVGPVDSSDPDAVVIHSTEPVAAAARWPGGRYGRTGHSGIRQVDMSELLQTSPDLATFEEEFRQAAVL